jgi:hypothetical protein
MPLFYKKLSKSQEKRTRKIKNYQKAVDRLIKCCKIQPTKGTQMQKIITRFTEEEIVALGRAMERLGYTSLEKFIADAAAEKAASATGNPNH